MLMMDSSTVVMVAVRLDIFLDAWITQQYNNGEEIVSNHQRQDKCFNEEADQSNIAGEP